MSVAEFGVAMSDCGKICMLLEREREQNFIKKEKKTGLARGRGGGPEVRRDRQSSAGDQHLAGLLGAAQGLLPVE